MALDIRALIETPSADGHKLFVLKLVMVMSRLGARWQLIRLAPRAAGSSQRIADTPYAVTLDIVLAEIERAIRELKIELRTGRGLATAALLKSIHDAVRGVRTEIDLSADQNAGRRLTALRSQVSDVLRGEIEGLTGRVSRLIRPRPSEEIAPDSALDPMDLQTTEALIEFVGACRFYASELAVDDLTERAWSELERYLDAAASLLVDNLRRAGTSDRRFRRSQFDAALRFCGRVFGEQHPRFLEIARAGAAETEPKVAAKA